jgi:hypothetical protein
LPGESCLDVVRELFRGSVIAMVQHLLSGVDLTEQVLRTED